MMRRIFMLLVFLCCAGVAFGQKGYQIKVQLEHFKQGKLYLGNYYGKNTFLVDTAQISNKGFAVFQGEDKLPAGIYFILYPHQKKFFEFLIDKNQHFKILADTTAGFKNLSFKKSPTNVLFRNYNLFIDKEHHQLVEAKQTNADSAALASLNHDIKENINQYRLTQIKKYPKTVLASLFKAMQVPIVPKKLKNTKAAYYYFKKNYWDSVDFSDSSIVRSPILENRLSRYFQQLVPQNPDSVNHAADVLLKKAKANKEIFKFALWWLTSTYEKSPYMGMDAVFVHLVEQYYVSGDAYWVKEDQLQEIIKKASKISPNLIGNIAPEIKMLTPDRKPVKLSNVDAPYIVLVFWDPTCSHCKVVVPKLDSVYEDSWKKMGVKVVGVLSGGSKEQWLDFIKKHHLKDWVNIWDPHGESNYRRMYNVYQTPIIYLLGKYKKILAKDLDVEQLNGFLKYKER